MAEKKKTKVKANKELTTMVTPRFRVSYPHVFKPQAIGDAKPKYSVTMLVPKTTDMKRFKEVIMQAKIAKWGAKENWPDNIESPVSDGDDPKNADKAGYKDHWVIKASSNEDSKPVVVDENVEPILDQSKFYPGCYAIANVFATGWEYMNKNGVMFILDHIQKHGDGKPFGGKKPVDQVFSPVGADDDDGGDEEQDDVGF